MGENITENTEKKRTDDIEGSIENIPIENIIEAILFAAGEEVPLARLAAATDRPAAELLPLLRRMKRRYMNERRGIQLIEINDAFQLCSNPVYHPYIAQLYRQPRKKTLTPTLLETLAIVAYLQPVTKGRIEEIRGVSADHAVNRLLEYELICESGRLDAPGKPILFTTSDGFLRYFGLNSIDKLPRAAEAPPEAYEQLALGEADGENAMNSSDRQ